MKFGRFLAATLSIILILLCISSCSTSKLSEDSFSSYPDFAPEADDSIDLEINNSLANKEESEGAQNNSSEGEYERKIIRTANIHAETKKFDESLKAIELLCEKEGGYIEKSSQSGVSIKANGQSSGRQASYTIRIPAESFDTFNSELGGMLNVTSSSSYTSEVTSQYYDIQSRIEVLELQKASLQEMYNNYTDYKDVDSLLRLQDQLYSVIEEIESYKTRLNIYDSKIAYSTLNLTVTEVIEYTVVEEEKDFFTELKDAFLDGCEFALDLLKWIAIAIAAATPVLIPIAVIVVIIGAVVLVIVKVIISIKKRKAAKKKPEQNNS